MTAFPYARLSMPPAPPADRDHREPTRSVSVVAPSLADFVPARLALEPVAPDSSDMVVLVTSGSTSTVWAWLRLCVSHRKRLEGPADVVGASDRLAAVEPASVAIGVMLTAGRSRWPGRNGSSMTGNRCTSFS